MREMRPHNILEENCYVSLHFTLTIVLGQEIDEAS